MAVDMVLMFTLHLNEGNGVNSMSQEIRRI